MVLVILKSAMQDSIKLSEKQMLSYTGGAISAALVNAFNGIIKTCYTVGQNLGSAFRRLISHNYC